jgi:uncharacterized protein (TIGR02145 family)
MKNLLKIIAVAILLLTVTVSCKKEVNKTENATNVTPPENPTNPEEEEKGVVINGVTWATRNVNTPGTFAAKSEDAGMFYQWNKKVGWSTIDSMFNSNGGTTWANTYADGDTWAKENDPCPKGWRVPTLEEQESLVNTESRWITQNGINGRIFGDGDTTLFFPAIGFRSSSNGTPYGVGYHGTYWGASPNGSENAYIMHFHRGHADMAAEYRSFGISVRCVLE